MPDVDSRHIHTGHCANRNETKGTVAVVVYRLQEGQQVLEYIWQHLPETIKAEQG